MGTISSAAQTNVYTFSANAGDLANFTVVKTGSGSLIPEIKLYNPDGTLNTTRWSNYPNACGVGPGGDEHSLAR